MNPSSERANGATDAIVRTSVSTRAISPSHSRIVPAPADVVESDVSPPAWESRRAWSARWIRPPATLLRPFVAAFRLRLLLAEDTVARIVVSADERYDLFIDGVRVGRGPERSDPLHWAYEAYELHLSRGEHMLVARTWALGELSPMAQTSAVPGFILSPLDPAHVSTFATGHAPWEFKALAGYSFTDPMSAWGTGARLDIDGRQFAWGFERGLGAGWITAETGPPGNSDLTRNVPSGEQVLRPAELPAMLDRTISGIRVRLISAPNGDTTSTIPVQAADHIASEEAAWRTFLDEGQSLIVPPHTQRRVILDLDDYYCAYHELRTSGGAGSIVRIFWQESLYQNQSASEKGHRDEIEGKYFVTTWSKKDGIGDTFRPDGGENRSFESLWWHAGRYVEILVITQDEPLALHQLTLRETRYPLEMESRIEFDDPRLSTIVPLAVRTLQMCSHETYMDCPYFEQLMYIGDGRIEALITYAITRDDRLPKKALRTFEWSRLSNGLTQSRYPSRIRQIIAPFSLWWIGMLHDFAHWRNDREFVRELLPAARGVLDYFLNCRVDHGLIGGMAGWNFLDWTTGWTGGVPPDGKHGANASFNWQVVLALRQAAELEIYAGDPVIARRYQGLAKELARLTNVHFWNENRGLYADALDHATYSEHAQCLGLLAGGVPARRKKPLARNLLTAPDLARATIYFSHYLFEAYRLLGHADAVLDRLSMWSDLAACGFKTLLEHPEPSRSDCHAWASHPLFHQFATLAGVRPAAPGFARVEIAPMLGSLVRAHVELVHPQGDILIDIERTGTRVQARITLPPEIPGVFRWRGKAVALQPGSQTVEL